MKNFYFITLLLISAFTQAQIVNIPDANFKNALVNSNCVDSNGDGYGDIDADINNDGEIQVSEAETVIGLYVPYQEIISIEGLQSFINLEYLDLFGNELTSLNVNQNTNLKRLQCGNNEINNLDVTNNHNLEFFSCVSNQLTSLDILQNPNLIYLRCGSNLLEYLDVTQNTNLLGLGFHLNQLSSIDLTQNTNLHELDCRGNHMENLYLNQNTNLKTLWCYDNLLTSLDLSQNTNLEWLYCYNNQLTSLNINNGNNVNLTRMISYNNPNLECIQVDDENYSNNQDCSFPFDGWCKDDWAAYSEKCILSTNDITTTTFTIFPNPARNVLNINAKGQIETIRILSLQGKLIKENSSSSIDISTLSKGMYFVQVSIDGKTSTKKFIKR